MNITMNMENTAQETTPDPSLPLLGPFCIAPLGILVHLEPLGVQVRCPVGCICCCVAPWW